MRKRLGLVMVIGLLAAGLLVGCGTPRTAREAAPTQEIVVFAGAGLKDALAEVADLYRRQHPGTKVSFNFAGAGTLQKQVEQGTPADVVIFPGERQMNALEKEKLIDRTTRKKILADKLVLITPKDVKKVKGFTDLASPGVGRVSIGDPATVPAGEWAKETLVNLGLWDKVQPKLVLARDVQQVRAHVETGNVDAGLVWRSTAVASPKVRIAAEAPAKAHRPIFFTGAVLSNIRQKEAAAAFLRYLTGPEAAVVFARRGFTPLATAR